MLSLLSILLYLGLVFSPNGYEYYTIQVLEAQNREQIGAIQTDPTRSQAIYDRYGQDAEKIAISDWEEEE